MDENWEIDRNMAWTNYKNVADAKINGNKIHWEWLESATFTKMNGEWKIALIHSTMIPPPTPQEQSE